MACVLTLASLCFLFFSTEVSAERIGRCPDEAKTNIDDKLFIHGDVCYQFVLNRRVDFSTAKQTCEDNNGILVLVKTKEINNYLVDILRNQLHFNGNKVWIGLEDNGIYKDGHYRWVDGTYLNDTGFSNWADYEGPLDGLMAQLKQDCVAIDPIRNGKWADYKCMPELFTLFPSSHGSPYICQYQTISLTITETMSTQTIPVNTMITTVPPTSVLIEDRCPTVLRENGHGHSGVHDGICYQFITESRTNNYDGAESVCESYGGSLAVVKSDDINRYLVNVLKNELHYNKGSVWIGLNDKGKWQDGNYRWEDGTYLDDTGYSNWADQQGPLTPGLLTGVYEDCIAMDPAHNGQWSDYDCHPIGDSDVLQRAYICQYASSNPFIKPNTYPTIFTNSHTTVTSMVQSSSTLPPNFDICPHELIETSSRYIRIFQKTCYQFVLQFRTNHENARSVCEAHGGSLVVINSSEVNSFLLNVLQNEFTFDQKTSKQLWIGLQEIRDDEKGVKYRWNDGTDLTDSGFTNWNVNQTLQGNSCIAMDRVHEGKWSYNQCTTDMPFICQFTSGMAFTTKTTAGVSSNQTTPPKPTSTIAIQTTSLSPSTTYSTTETTVAQTMFVNRTTSTATSTPSAISNFPSTINTKMTSATATNSIKSPTTSTTVKSTSKPSTTANQSTTTSTRSPSTNTTMMSTSNPTSTIIQSTTPTTELTTTSTTSTITTTHTTTPILSTSTTTTTTTATTTQTTPPETTQQELTTLCPPFECTLDCGMDGYKVDSLGCSVCKCDD